jgi:hypothetical protein
MPVCWPTRRFAPKPEKTYRGFYGVGAQSRIAAACRRKGRRAVFPDCRSV